MSDKMNNRAKKRKKAGKGASRTTGFLVAHAPPVAGAALHPMAFPQYVERNPVPTDWDERARLSWRHYLEEPIVHNAINAWRAFTLGAGVQFACDDEAVGREVEAMARRLKLDCFLKDMIGQWMVKGECVGYLLPDASGDDLEELVCVNPVGVRARYEGAKLVEMTQFPDLDLDGRRIDLPPDRVIYLKRAAPSAADRGLSMVVAAMRSIDLLRDLRAVERTIARRLVHSPWIVEVGGQFGGKTIIPDQKTLDELRDAINRMDMKAGLVVPFYVRARPFNPQASLRNVEEIMRSVKEDLMIALGMPRALVAGDGAKFSTARLSLHKIKVMIKEIRWEARQILNAVFADWKRRKGLEGVCIHYLFDDLDLDDPIGQRKLLLDLYDRGLVSRTTLQKKMWLDPKVEEAERQAEARRPIPLEDAGTILDLVDAGIMSPETARERLGLDGEGEKPDEK